ncbi:MAG: phosphodiester glycosidase family protein [Oscillospiraceae bacterium]|nr:phosphodiester glycosidase family protein [Oscillospiraceae bacterium]
MKYPASIRRGAAALTALALLLTLTPAARADSPAYGSQVWLRDTAIQDGVVFSDNIFWSDYYSQFRHEYYITYTPGSGVPIEGSLPETGEDAPPVQDDPAVPGGQEGADGSETAGDGEDGNREPDTDIPYWLLPQEETGRRERSAYAATGVTPVVAFGTSVCDRLTASSVAQYYEGAGYRVLGVINGDFYDTATGFPLGMLVSHGRLLSSCGGYYAVGFRSDGSVVMGQPQLTVTAQSGGQSLRLASVNKPRVSGSGVTMLTYDFRSDHTTGNSVAKDGVNVLATIVEGDAAIGGQMVLQVLEVSEDAAVRTLQPGQVLLTGAADGYETGLAFLRSLTPGAAVTLSFATADPAWNDVREAIGALYLLVDNGVPQTGFEATAAPRTAVGVKANGDLVLYTIDGRQTGHSMGAALGVLAQRMAELGCVTALCLDGGGSTTIVSTLPDSGASQVMNSPSDRSQRKVSNHIVLLAPGGATGEPWAVNLSAGAPAVLPGHTVALTANLADSHYYPMAGDIQYSASAGTVTGGVLTAPLESGTVTVTASYGGISAQTEILVIDQPDGVTVQKNGADITRLDLTPGESVQLGLSAVYRRRTLEAWPTDFQWRLTPELGTIDENGLLTASLTGGTGYLSAIRGDCSVTIPVAIHADSPFADTAGHWAEDFMTDLYYQGILTGSTSGGVLYAYPDNGVTRAEFAVLLCRYLNLDPSAYAGTAIPFADIEQVDTWARDSVRAMYTLGIVNGTTIDGQLVFDPQGTLTRSQAVAMLGRMLALNDENGEPELPEIPDGGSQFLDLVPLPEGGFAPEEDPGEEPGEKPVELGDLSQFTDAAEILPYAVEHFQTLVGMGVIQGSNGRLDPNATMTRSAICKVLSTLPDALAQ